MKNLTTLAVCFVVLCFASSVDGDVVTTFRDAANFSHFFSGTDVHNGTSYQNGFSEFSAGDATVYTDLGGGVLGVTNTGRSAMVDGSLSTNGSSTWTDNLGPTPYDATSDYTIEIKLGNIDAAAGFRIWGGHGDGRDFLDIYNDRVTITNTGGGFVDVPLSLSDGATHTFRVANDATSNTLTMAHVWVDGMMLTDAVGNPRTSGTNDSRLLFGDPTSGTFGDDADFDLHYFAYDQTDAFAPVPEPSTTVLLSSMFALIALRRRRK